MGGLRAEEQEGTTSAALPPLARRRCRREGPRSSTMQGLSIG